MTDRRSDLRILSVCRGLPTPSNASDGVFVLRRLQAMGEIADVRIVQPYERFPVIRTVPDWARLPDHDAMGLTVHHEGMISIPKILKFLDGYWMSHAVMRARSRVARDTNIIDSHFGYPEGVGAAIAGQRLGIPAFATFRGFEAEYLQRPVTGRLIRRSFAQLTGLICVSHFLKNLAIENGADPDKTTVIHNAIDRDRFCPGSRKGARSRLGLPLDNGLVVSVGHLTPRKRHHVLIDAFSTVHAQNRNCRLVIIGAGFQDPAYPLQLKNQVRKLGLDEAVRFVGNVDPLEIVYWLRAANVFGLATQREGCCNAILEALAVGIPVVTTPVGDNSYFIEDGVNGYIVPVDDAVAMGNALQVALASSDWDENNISSMLNVGAWSDTASQVIDFFRKMAISNGSAQRNKRRALNEN